MFILRSSLTPFRVLSSNRGREVELLHDTNRFCKPHTLINTFLSHSTNTSIISLLNGWVVWIHCRLDFFLFRECIHWYIEERNIVFKKIFAHIVPALYVSDFCVCYIWMDGTVAVLGQVIWVDGYIINCFGIFLCTMFSSSLTYDEDGSSDYSVLLCRYTSNALCYIFIYIYLLPIGLDCCDLIKFGAAVIAISLLIFQLLITITHYTDQPIIVRFQPFNVFLLVCVNACIWKMEPIRILIWHEYVYFSC